MQNIFEQVTFTEKDETKELVSEVVERSYNMVCCTMGPNSGLVLINNLNKPTVTKDGVSAARALDFGEHRRNMIAELITSAAIRVDDIVGDGTTTTVFMVKYLYTAFGAMINFGSTRIINELITRIKGYLSEEVKEVTPDSEDFKRMINTTTNYNTDISDNVIRLFKEYKSPNISLMAGSGHPSDIITVQKDIVFEGEYAAPHLKPNTAKQLTTLENCAVLLFDAPVNEISDEFIRTIMEHITTTGRAVVIVARSFDPNTLAQLTNMNRMINSELNIHQSVISVIPYALDAPGTFGATMFNDIGTIIESDVYTVIPDNNVLKNTLSVIVPKLTLDKEGIKFNSNEVNVKTRVDSILAKLESSFDEMSITEKATVMGKLALRRISRLRAENVSIIVTGMTEGEISERYFLYEDAVRAAQTSLRFGVIPGIGYGFNRAAEKLVRDIIFPLSEKSHLTYKERCYDSITRLMIAVLLQPYKFLTGEDYIIYSEEDDYIFYPESNTLLPYDVNCIDNDTNIYTDLVTGEGEKKPVNVFDNGCAGMCAIESAWSVVKQIGRLEAILGKSNSSYVKK